MMLPTLNAVSMDQPKHVILDGKRYLSFKIHCKLRRLYNVLILSWCHLLAFAVVYALFYFMNAYFVHNSIIERRPITVYDYKLHRFIGENISLLCEPGFNPDDVTYTWLLNGSEITADSRHRFYTPHHSHQWFSVWYLTDNDFGEYSCEIRYKSGRRLKNSFFVDKIYEIHDQAVVPIGEFLVVYLFINNVPGYDDLFYTVDRVPQVHTRKILRCSWFSSFYLDGFHSLINPMKNIYYDSYTVKYIVCPCPDRYGYYRFYIRSQMFNPELNEYESTVVQLPLVYHVIADKSIRYDNPLFNISTITSGPLKPNEISEGDIKEETETFFMEDTILFLVAFSPFVGVMLYLDLHLYFVQIILWPIYGSPVYVKENQTKIPFSVAIILAVIFLFYFFLRVGNSLFGTEIILFLILRLNLRDLIIVLHILNPTECHNQSSTETPPLCGIPPLCELKQTYDIYLSYSDSDVIFVRDNILPFLEGQELKVFFRERDILPGQPDLTGSEKAICESKAFLILATCHYVKDFSRNNIELPMIRYLVNISNMTPCDIVLILLTSGFSWNRCVFDKYMTIKLKRKFVLQKTEMTNVTAWLNKLK